MRITGVGLALALVAGQANAVVYQTVLDYTPTGVPPGSSSDPADGNRLVLDWETSLTSGTVFADDLDALTLSLFGTGGLIYSDTAIVGGVAQDLGGVPRDLATPGNGFFGSIDFEFDLDPAPAGGPSGLLFVDNDSFLEQQALLPDFPGATGVTYSLAAGSLFFEPTPPGEVFVAAGRFEDGDLVLAESTTNIRTSPIPLPAPALLLMGGLACLALAGRRRG